MKNIKIISFAAITTFMAFSLAGCSKLDDKTFDAISKETVDGEQAAIDPVLALQGVYDGLNDFSDQAGVYGLTELPTDEQMLPTRGTDWGDFGVWRKLHQHTWDPFNERINEAWDRLNRNIFRANQAIAFAGANNQVKGEASFLRAWYMFHVIDLFGQVPFREVTDGPEANPKVYTRAEATDLMIKDLEFAEANLAYGAPGRASKGAAQALLAKVYLNKAVFTSTTPGGPYTFAKADMDKAIDYSNKVIASGRYNLGAKGEYFNNFHWDNSTLSKELIFVVENIEGAVKANVQNRFRMTLHYSQTPDGWNGFTTLADFYKSFEAGDERIGGSFPGLSDKIGLKTGFLVGQQFGPGQVPLKNRSGQPLVFTPDANLLFATEEKGIRVIKYLPKPNDANNGINDQAGNDYIFLRYADVLLMKAEAIQRGGTDATGQSAALLVNNLRTVRGASTPVTVDDKMLLAERGRELYWEGWRRNDMIRFGVFHEPVDQRETKSDPSRSLFPIPQRAVDTNPNLSQNPGY
ncbi:MAG TPA: RagB/SusD family nutrient uptake outer membrane protein [Daejeonella sp.]|nr:RagB/SusD family nutrient uptake outer membrane protein [Daejeonella sp.]